MTRVAARKFVPSRFERGRSPVVSCVPMDTEFDVTCPYCGESLVIYLEPDVRGALVQDCEVCCRPWSVLVTWDGGERWVQVSRGDGSE